ncbi:hypothetical protein [Corynebacterium macclintockiae]|uniref:hypothetical protein n=1 Tax=Corynebacterium macclintockiae TaxID=2913501 RepID=UPI003EB77836
MGEHVTVDNFSGGGVDGFFGDTSAETIVGVAVTGVWFIGGGKADGLFTGGVVVVVGVGRSLASLYSTPSLPKVFALCTGATD